MIKFDYNSTMKRYDVSLPMSLSGRVCESDLVLVASISEHNKVRLHTDLSIGLLRQILLSWDEKEHMDIKRAEREAGEFDKYFDGNNQECKHLMNPETCISCEEEKGDK